MKRNEKTEKQTNKTAVEVSSIDIIEKLNVENVFRLKLLNCFRIFKESKKGIHFLYFLRGTRDHSRVHDLLISFRGLKTVQSRNQKCNYTSSRAWN